MSEVIIYKTADKQTQVEVKFDNDTVWLNQAQFAELFQKNRTVISKHLNNVFKEGELNEKVECAKFAHSTEHGALPGKTKEKTTRYYYPDAIISVGYRVNSKRGTQFRQWATQRFDKFLTIRW